MIDSKNDKITIKNIPLSVSNDQIRKLIEDNDLHTVSPIKYGYIRDDDGQLTKYKSGDRFVYVKAVDKMVPRKQKVGEFPCIVIHHGKSLPCLACGRRGHKVADDNCIAKPTRPILAFRSYEHPLSTQYPCTITYLNKEFTSVDHAYYRYMARAFGNDELATRI